MKLMQVSDSGGHKAAESTPGPPAVGACHYCLAPVAPPRRWCNATCRSVWLQDERDLGVEWGEIGE